jgi:hypothetical protein
LFPPPFLSPPPPVVTTPRRRRISSPCLIVDTLAFCLAAAATPRPLLVATASPVVVAVTAAFPPLLPRRVAAACRHLLCRCLPSPPPYCVLQPSILSWVAPRGYGYWRHTPLRTGVTASPRSSLTLSRSALSQPPLVATAPILPLPFPWLLFRVSCARRTVCSNPGVSACLEFKRVTNPLLTQYVSPPFPFSLSFPDQR